MNVFIDGFGIASYRSFGDELQFLGPFAQINILIGQNNCGKSNVIRFLKEHYGKLAKAAIANAGVGYGDLDSHLGVTSGTTRVAFGLRPGSGLHRRILERHKLHEDGSRHIAAIVERLLKFKELFDADSGVSWFVHTNNPGRQLALSEELVEGMVNHRLANRPGTPGGLESREWEAARPPRRVRRTVGRPAGWPTTGRGRIRRRPHRPGRRRAQHQHPRYPGL